MGEGVKHLIWSHLIRDCHGAALYPKAVPPALFPVTLLSVGCRVNLCVCVCVCVCVLMCVFVGVCVCVFVHFL